MYVKTPTGFIVLIFVIVYISDVRISIGRNVYLTFFFEVEHLLPVACDVNKYLSYEHTKIKLLQ